MPKIRANLAEIETDYVPVDPDLYEVEIVDVEERIHDYDAVDRVEYIIRSKIISGQATDTTFAGRTLFDRIHMHRRDGTLNTFGAIQLKRWVEAALGHERANDPDLDTEELHGQRVLAQVSIREYERRETDPKTGLPRLGRTNQIEQVASL